MSDVNAFALAGAMARVRELEAIGRELEASELLGKARILELEAMVKNLQMTSL